MAINPARPFSGWLRLVPTAQPTSDVWTTSTLDLSDEFFGALRFPADVRAKGQELIDSYSPGLAPHLADRAYRRFAAFVRQAENYYRSAKTLPYRSSALLYYYSFMNLAKAALAARAIKFDEDHGLKPGYGNPPSDLTQLRVRVLAKGIFPALYHLIFSQPIQNVQLQLSQLLAYVSEVAVQYHEATQGQPKVARYARARLLHDNAQQQSWLLLAWPNALPLAAQPAPVQHAFTARFQQVTVAPPMARELFDLLVPGSLAHEYFQSFPPVPIATPHAVHTQYILDALLGCVHPIYLEDEKGDFVLTVHCSATNGSTWPMNEICAIYLSMFFMGSLVRYRADILEDLLGTSAAWLLESFVNSAPLLLLRTMTSVVLNRLLIFTR